jgi:hypothetical protein
MSGKGHFVTIPNLQWENSKFSIKHEIEIEIENAVSLVRKEELKNSSITFW